MDNKEPTREQIKEFWEWCGFKIELIPYSNGVGHWEHEVLIIYPDGIEKYRISTGDYPDIDLNNLFKYAVPPTIKRLENRFTDETYNRVRGLELLFHKWIDKIAEGYSLEDGLFWAIWEVQHE